MTDGERADERTGDYETFEAWAIAQTTTDVVHALFRCFPLWAKGKGYDLAWHGKGRLFVDINTDIALEGYIGGWGDAMDIAQQALERNRADRN